MANLGNESAKVLLGKIEKSKALFAATAASQAGLKVEEMNVGNACANIANASGGVPPLAAVPARYKCARPRTATIVDLEIDRRRKLTYKIRTGSASLPFRPFL